MAAHDNRNSHASAGILFLVVIFLFVVVLILLVRTLRSGGSAARALEAPAPAPASVSEGVAYLRSLEAQDPGEVEDIVRAVRQEELAAMRRQRIDDLATGAADVWSLFEDYVIVGDSRPLGFSYYGHLPEDRVLAEMGRMLYAVDDMIDEIRKFDPSVIFLSFGVNDLDSHLWESGPSYAERYGEVIDHLQREFPDATLVVNSIQPIIEPTFHLDSIYGKIPEMNECVKQMCAERGVVYVDNTPLCEAHTDLYEGDGIHFRSSFYAYWAANMFETMLEYEEGEPAL